MSAESIPFNRQRVRQEVNRTMAEEQIATLPRTFEARGDDRYVFAIKDVGIELEVDRLRREHHQLIGEFSARCSLAGARTIDTAGTLSVGDLNLSSVQARTARSKLLALRARTNGAIDWDGYLEEFVQRVLAAERAGAPAVDLRDMPAAGTDATFDVMGIKVPRVHPSILFGDGSSGKSYIALFLAGKLAENGARVALFDWELAGEDHRDRLERLFPDGMPHIRYARCEKPLVYEADRLRRIVRDDRIEYCFYDSIAFACDGPPEAAEVAGRYFRAVRQIGGGSMHIAHVSRSENADQKPFGSIFWHNSGRSTWNVKLADSTSGTDTLTVGLFNRKANLGKLCPPIGLTITFQPDTTIIRRTDIAASADLAPNLSVRQRMAYLLRKGAFSPEQIADEIEADIETVKRTQRRYKEQFTVLDGGKIGLLERNT